MHTLVLVFISLVRTFASQALSTEIVVWIDGGDNDEGSDSSTLQSATNTSNDRGNNDDDDDDKPIISSIFPIDSSDSIGNMLTRRNRQSTVSLAMVSSHVY